MGGWSPRSSSAAPLPPQGAPAGRRGARPEHAAAQSRPGPALVAGQPAGTGLLAFRSQPRFFSPLDRANPLSGGRRDPQG